MRWNLIGAFVRNNPFGTEIAFRKGLERLGETVSVYDPSVLYKSYPLDVDADATIVFKWLDPGPMRDGLKFIGGKKIIYQVDDLRFPHIKNMMTEMLKYCEHALTFDESGAQLAIEYGYDSAKRLLLTADNTLYRPISGMKKDIDVTFIGSLSHGANHTSRMKMIDLVSKIKGIRFLVANEIFDIGKICEIYSRSKIILNHATDVGQPFGHGYGYQCRHFEAGFTRSCVLTNTVDNENEIGWLKYFSDEKSLLDQVDWLLQDEKERELYAGELYSELYSRHLPEHRAEELIQFVKDIS